MTDNNDRSIATFAALKTSIVNGELASVKSLLANRSMHDLEKSYLLDLAKMNNQRAIIELLEAVPVKK
ncbi:hypothetical protein [Marinospirillum insulare]|uniref:Uncharacterized protein n=1 Tax=Marinospirillum insulare TaxID=217169 RepID=A0ABQ5ZWK4_9GAMM|nr:hypothetical protein [Marinospirillum insulare]GLR63851.1 hypothetical protein GCM10007878_12880 [Marinospirillum insulare]